MPIVHLPRRGLLVLSGEDTLNFLQGIISNDAQHLKNGRSIYTALLSPQGKFLFDFFIVPYGADFLLDGEKERLPELLKKLQMYKLRSQVTMAPAPEALAVFALWGDAAPVALPKNLLCFADPRVPELGSRIIGEKADVDVLAHAQGWAMAGEAAYDHRRLDFGVPDGSRDMMVDKTLLLECHFEALHGVDFKKGCYIGQEVTARTRYRGQVKKLLYRVESSGADLPEAGTPVTAGDAEIGEMRSHCGQVGLAILRAEDVEKAQVSGVPLMVQGVEIRAQKPRWAGAQENATHAF